ncbi:OmpA family protein [uncultured Dokdonia sp.]|uniref:OmpA family protein n=1 Tax=uncultured Dokdonia sp. TaxID=575653 RepID=UPI0026327DE2|nr:OmpA family protein [uncultured Dokdonia sp.]
MKALQIIFVFCLLLCGSGAKAQLLKKLGEVAEKSAERAVERRVEKETTKKTDQALDSVFSKKKKKKKKKKKRKNKNKKGKEDSSTSDNETTEPTYTIKRSSDFTPGNIILFEDRFTRDNPGDFPAQWDTNGSGEVAMINNEKWMRLSGKSKYVPMLKEALPENYTIEFDLFTNGLDKKTSSQAFLTLLIEDNTGFTRSKNWCMTELSVCQFIGNQGVVEKVANGKRQLRNQIGKDYRDAINGKSHISIAVNKTRMRVWLNENKIIDIPRLIPEGANSFKLATRGLRDPEGLDEVYIANFSMTKIGEDNRSKLLTEGRLTTNNILFESASATLKDTSFSTIREIANVLEQNPEVRIKIIGHTDSDGQKESNRTLSRKRAEAVKKMMTSAYGIDASRISTDGMGDSEPVASNTTKEGKALNRRVEFIKL